MSNQTIIGVDVGGTKIIMGRVANERILAELSLPTRVNGSEKTIVNDIILGISQLINNKVTGIGIGVPGLVDEEKGIVYNPQNIPSWKEVHLKTQIELHFGKPVFISNDANCFAQGEKFFGKGKQYRNMVCLTLGTGVGAGIIINNRLYTGTLSVSGEFGSIPYLQHNYEYYCSGKFFSECHGITGTEAYNLAMSGDVKSREIFKEYGEHLGNLIKTILLCLGPEAIILGGSVTKSFQFFRKSMMESIYMFPHKKITDQLVIEVAKNEKIAIIGAAALIYNK